MREYKLERTKYGDYKIIEGRSHIGFIEYNADYTRHKYAIYINGVGKLTSQGYDVFNFTTAKKVLKEYMSQPEKKEYMSQPEKVEYVFYSDPAHEWLRVPLNEVLPDMNISKFSYRDNQYAYLEEDSDAGKWMDKNPDAIIRYKVLDLTYNFIRSLPRYKR